MKLDPANFSSAAPTASERVLDMPRGAGGEDAERARVVAAAEKFESFFIADMLKQMRSVTREMADEDSLFQNRINQDMLEIADGKLADVLAGQRAFGVADAILAQLLPEARSPAAGGRAGASSAAAPAPAATPATPFKSRP
ncbi:flagellar biosynthesis protein FlgJ [Zoogloea sp. LCSB751]|uniref:flagellar biosynthesis protein FlgJ n=1 Tax=Zoogloea sp. LCSB751 TaxID=1965277 RepID=UPI000B4969E9|nr:flagellar biosynthesis protein FlgJ [Zoogloea sp. LCSB751]